MANKKTDLTLIVPTVHLNGSGYQSLVDQCSDVIDAISKALDAMRQATPHDRDYYVQEDGSAGQNARDAHSDRMRKLETVSQEVMEIARGIMKQRR